MKRAYLHFTGVSCSKFSILFKLFLVRIDFVVLILGILSVSGYILCKILNSKKDLGACIYKKQNNSFIQST